MPTINLYEATGGNNKLIYETANFETISIEGFEIEGNQIVLLDAAITPNLAESEAAFWVRAQSEINEFLFANGFIELEGVFADFGTPTAVLATTEVLIKNPTSLFNNALSLTTLDYTINVTGAATKGNYTLIVQEFVPDVTNAEFEELATNVANLDNNVLAIEDDVEEIQQQTAPLTTTLSYNQQQLYLQLGITIPN